MNVRVVEEFESNMVWQMTALSNRGWLTHLCGDPGRRAFLSSGMPLVIDSSELPANRNPSLTRKMQDHNGCWAHVR